jgi:hypothetical protein
MGLTPIPGSSIFAANSRSPHWNNRQDYIDFLRKKEWRRHQNSANTDETAGISAFTGGNTGDKKVP